MKTALAFVIVLALAGNIAAQETGAEQPAPPQPDFSRAKLTMIFANEPKREVVEPRIHFGFGYIDFRALKMRWRVNYLPIMLPLSGSIPWRGNGAFQNVPDPFELTNTTLATPPRAFKRTRDMNAELKRIEKSERAKAKVTVKPE